VYLRDRAYYRAEVEFTQQLDATRTRATITFRIKLGERTTVGAFPINIDGFDAAGVRSSLALQPGAPFTQEALGADINRIRQAIIARGYLAPRINEPQIQLDQESNQINVTLSGQVGPQAKVVITGYDELSDETARELLPVMREGTIDKSAIVEGERRIRNRLQENGYFFAEANANCAVVPPLVNTAAVPAGIVSNTSSTATTTTTAAAAIAGPPQTSERGAATASCDNLNPEELSGRAVTITYVVEPGRRYKLTEIRIEGTEKLTVDDVAGELRTKEANALGFIPVLGYGRGYTSEEALERDRQAIEARMRDLGYRQAKAVVLQGVSLEDENLIITFGVTEGPLTRVAGVQVRGNQIYTAEMLRDAACPSVRDPEDGCTIIDGPFSRSQARVDADRIRTFYARNGYFDAVVNLDVVDLPNRGADEQVRLIYTVNESDKVFINQIYVNGVVRTRREAILNAIPIRRGDLLRAAELAESERIINATDVFRQVIIRTEAAGETDSGFKRRDVIIDVEERQRITTDYIVGFSTDNGPLGGFEIRNNNLFGQLRQGALRTRASRRQQLLRLEYFDQRFQRYGRKDFAPLTVSAQYQRDSNVTRFFRSTIDRGNFGIVQRFDDDGNPIDELGQPVGEPTVNRFTINVETQRDLELELGPRGRVLKRSTVFLRYNYEDVRLFNTSSLLIAEVLRPDRAVRLSRFGATLARDTRDSQFDPSRGDFLTADYAIALKQLGGNISFSKFLSTYRRYYKIDRVRPTVLAGAIQLGLARLYSPSDRNDDGVIDAPDRTLPISERFFSGGSTTLRGFGFEEAGPRLAVCPGGQIVGSRCPAGNFRNEQGEPVTLNPFLVPIGGNALAIVNLEARVGVTKSVQVVPFYDGGNVFRRVSDIFRRAPREGEDPNLQAKWTHTVGLGLRLKTPFGPLSVDYGYLLNPPTFVLPQGTGIPADIIIKRGQLHFRFGQTF
ncbi:MAG: BamA/TamA family outer membrane protein, partial [Pyrinomonadaceae bacterium]|nr:BamA/TamA family outer membrane protein [Pyrinomonadaceae bacterium]